MQFPIFGREAEQEAVVAAVVKLLVLAAVWQYMWLLVVQIGSGHFGGSRRHPLLPLAMH